ncbi:MAG: hypothetical protein ACRENA_07430 [Vulcanimicrobiaceae bacterium]
MPERNRVTPYGEIVRSPLRGAWLGNRGCIHRDRDIVRPWNGKRWIICALEFKGWVAPKWVPGRWTALFFYDEAVAFAAGHRPCALCRRAAYNEFCQAVGMTGADAIDLVLHEQRVHRREESTHVMPWRELPAGTFVDIDGTPHVVLRNGIYPWSAADGYGSLRDRPSRGDAVVLTPPLSVQALHGGYDADIRCPSTMGHFVPQRSG